MGEETGQGKVEESVPDVRRAAVFVLLLVLYYAVYYVFFALRLSEYFRDLLRHFEFFRRLFQ